jgi:hypothetical protein
VLLLTEDHKIRATPPAGDLPDHIRGQLRARREDVIALLETESQQTRRQVWRQVGPRALCVFNVYATNEYEKRKPHVSPVVRRACWAILAECLPGLPDDVDVMYAGLDAFRGRMVEYWQTWDAAHPADAEPSVGAQTTPTATAE